MNLLKGTLHYDSGSIQFQNDHIDVDVSAYPFVRTPGENQPCVLGVDLRTF